MKAVILKEYGNADVLSYEDVEKPSPKADEILVKVKNIGVNPIEWKVRNGMGKDFGLKLPIILGTEISGTIEEIGAEISDFKAGDEVYGNINMMRGGGYAEYVIAKESEIAVKPDILDFESAAAVPVGALTAWKAIFTTADLQAGQKILIHGAAGAVGSFAVQLAKIKGAYVYATASGKNEDFVKSLGADEFIDYTKTNFESIVKDADVVLDTIGGETQQRSFEVLKKGGFLVALSAPPSAELAEKFGVKAEMIQSGPNGKLLNEISDLINEGKISAFVETVLPLSDVKKAHELSESRHARGKIVLSAS